LQSLTSKPDRPRRAGSPRSCLRATPLPSASWWLFVWSVQRRAWSAGRSPATRLPSLPCLSSKDSHGHPHSSTSISLRQYRSGVPTIHHGDSSASSVYDGRSFAQKLIFREARRTSFAESRVTAATLHPCSRRWRGNCIEAAPSGFEPGTKVLQTSGRSDVKIYNTRSSYLINERLSLNLPFEPDFPPDLAAVINAWDRLPDTIKAGILAMVKVAVK
jgi:hypothetical protein